MLACVSRRVSWLNSPTRPSPELRARETTASLPEAFGRTARAGRPNPDGEASARFQVVFERTRKLR